MNQYFYLLVQSRVNAGLQQYLPFLVNWYHCWTVRLPCLKGCLARSIARSNKLVDPVSGTLYSVPPSLNLLESLRALPGTPLTKRHTARLVPQLSYRYHHQRLKCRSTALFTDKLFNFQSRELTI